MDATDQSNRFPLLAVAAVPLLPIMVVAIAVEFGEGRWGWGAAFVFVAFAMIHTAYGMLKQWWLGRVNASDMPTDQPPELN